MKYLHLLLVTLLFLLSVEAFSEWNYIGNYIEPYQVNVNTITFYCTNATIKIDMCTEDMLRIRMSQTGKFKPDEPYVVIKYEWGPVQFQIKDLDNLIEIITRRMIVIINKKPFSIKILEEDRNPVCQDYEEGAMGWEGEKVICRKKMFTDEHFFGLGQRYEKSDLRGIKKELNVTENITYIPFFMSTKGYGIFFHNNWKSIFDFTNSPYSFSAPGGELDYYIIYGPDFKHLIDQYTKITGKASLPPKWAFGLYYSKWDNQGGQAGILNDVNKCRITKNWPLDVVRVHSKGCSQNFWASPNTNWADEGWGSFSDVPKLVEELHKVNCHPIFWESPGVMNGCNMYYEGESKGYFILNKDGAVWNGKFGSGLFGALVDFSNPDACNWWTDYHKFLVNLGSDGVAGDHGEELDSSMYSAYSNLTGEEYHNLYPMLYNRASWEAYKTLNPNKRSISFGRSAWAGCQRYPMQGTQDSHEEGQTIRGEIMGAVNLGLSGVPFRTFTDNVTRGLLTGQTGLPVNRLSQYLCLNIAGERTGIIWTDNKTADDNYRFYARLRYQLMPYIYSYAWETTQTGSPVMRALVYENFFDKNTYDVYAQYLLGKELLIAPLWSDTTLERDIYLPGGEWIDFWDETTYKGMQTIKYKAPIDKVPILIKAGAIIPMAPANQKFMDENTSYLTFHIYPKGMYSYKLYEDDGNTYEYEKGIYALTTISYKETKKSMDIIKSAPEGKYSIPERDHLFCIHKKTTVLNISVNEKNIDLQVNMKNFENASEGWYFDKNKNLIWLKTKGKANESINISIKQ